MSMGEILRKARKKKYNNKQTLSSNNSRLDRTEPLSQFSTVLTQLFSMCCFLETKTKLSLSLCFVVFFED